MPAADFGSPSTRRPVVSSGGTPVMWAASGPRLTFACRSAASPPAPAAGTAPSPAAGEGVARDVLLLVRPPETQSDHPPPLVPPHAAGHRHGRAARRTAGGRHRHDSDEKRLHTLLGAMCPARPWPRRTPPSERAAAKAKKNRAAARTPSAAPPGPAQSWSAPPQFLGGHAELALIQPHTQAPGTAFTAPALFTVQLVYAGTRCGPGRGMGGSLRPHREPVSIRRQLVRSPAPPYA